MGKFKNTAFGKKAVVLLSGGLDSAVTLYSAKDAGFKCSCLIFDYGQRHNKEIECAKKISRRAGCGFKVLKIALPWKGSALLDRNTAMHPGNRRSGDQKTQEIPNTYVPGRNIIFLSFALSFAESIGARKIYIGAHAQDYSGYPDCRPEFYRAFVKVIATGTKAGVRGEGIRIEAPLLHKNKAQIIKLGKCLGVPFGLTWSCYRGGSRPCGRCDSCYYRAKGFTQARLSDPGTPTKSIGRVSP